MDSNYEDILSGGFDAIPEEKTLPAGSWLLKGRNASFLPPREEGKSGQVLFVYQPSEPMDDVEQDDLDKLGEGYNYKENQVFYRIWIEAKRDWDKVRKHLEKHGIDTSQGSITDILKKEFRGKEVIAYLNTRTFKDASGDDREENNPTNFTPVGS